VFNVFFKHPALRSNPRRWPGGLRAWDWQRHVHDKDQPELQAFLTDFRALLDATPGHMSVGELFFGGPHDAARHSAPRHLIFDFALCFTPWNSTALAATIDAREAGFGPERWPTVVLSNHDQPRHASRLARKRNRDAVAKSAAVLLLTLRGTPFLYYGEEIGMGDVRVPRREIVDPPARRYWPLPLWRNRDAARAPLPWTAEPVARSWMRMPADAGTRNVATQSANPDSVLSFYRRLLWLRRSVPALQDGDFAWEVRARSGVLAWWRTKADARVLVVINTRPAARTVSLPAAQRWEVLLSTHASAPSPPNGASMPLRPHEALILRETPGRTVVRRAGAVSGSG
jgi:alpha-glucosidase